MALPEKAIKELILFNERWIIDLKKSLNNPIQQLVGTGDIQLKIIELETELKILKDGIKQIQKHQPGKGIRISN